MTDSDSSDSSSSSSDSSEENEPIAPLRNPMRDSRKALISNTAVAAEQWSSKSIAFEQEAMLKEFQSQSKLRGLNANNKPKAIGKNSKHPALISNDKQASGQWSAKSVAFEEKAMMKEYQSQSNKLENNDDNETVAPLRSSNTVRRSIRNSKMMVP
eukprot:266869_1